MVATGSSAGTDGLGERDGFLQIVYVEIKMELLRHGIVRPRRRLVIHGQLESDLGAGVAANCDPIILGLLDLPAEQGGIKLG